MKRRLTVLLLLLIVIDGKNVFAQNRTTRSNGNNAFNGNYFSGTGNVNYLALLDSAYIMMRPHAQIENLSMLYKPEWNGFVEGPTWDMWWIQNSFGPTYTMLPFMDKAYQSFIFNSQQMWFDMMGNGVRKDANGFTGPVGTLCDAASLDKVYFRQGDGKVKNHDWGFGFTAAGIILQSELLLIRRNKAEIEHFLPLLELSAEFIDSRRDPVKNIFLVGPAANLLAPSFAVNGKLLPDGTYGKSYLAEISINYIAALNRLIELEKMMGRKNKATLFNNRIKLVKSGLSNFITPEGYFVRSIDLDGTKHGVYGAPVHGYFESVPNHDAMAFRVVNDTEAKGIYKMFKSIPQLRPHKLIIPNYPSYDDMYESGGLFTYGKWINGGHWTTCEARMQIGYYRVGAYDDAKDAFQQMLKRSYIFRLDNNLTDFGSKEYQPNLPVNCVYDCFGAPGGFLRGLFEYIYTSDGLRLYPHIPTGITSIQQKFPVYFGGKKIYVSVNGSGNITSVKVNGQPIKDFNEKSLFLKLDDKPGQVTVSIGLGNAPALTTKPVNNGLLSIKATDDFWDIDALSDTRDTAASQTSAKKAQLKKIYNFYNLLVAKNLSETYECKHAELILQSLQAISDRKKLKQDGKLVLLPVASQAAADDLYISTTYKLSDGLTSHLNKIAQSKSGVKSDVAKTWLQVKQD